MPPLCSSRPWGFENNGLMPKIQKHTYNINNLPKVKLQGLNYNTLFCLIARLDSQQLAHDDSIVICRL